MTSRPSILAKSFLLAAFMAVCASAASAESYSGRRTRLARRMPSGSYAADRPGLSRRLDLLVMSPRASAFERSFVCRIAKWFIDEVPVAQFGSLRVHLKIILE